MLKDILNFFRIKKQDATCGSFVYAQHCFFCGISLSKRVKIRPGEILYCKKCADAKIKAQNNFLNSIYMETLQFNINSNILVKLNDGGDKILADKHNSYRGFIPNWEERTSEYYKNKADKNGYTCMQAWHFMEVFGEHTLLCVHPPFDTTILIKKSDLKNL